MPTLKNWSVVVPVDPYLAPEQCHESLRGNVYGHPSIEDGTKVTTSRIISVCGRKIMTVSGTTYELENPEQGYVDYCRETLGREIDPDNPIVDRRQPDEAFKTICSS